MISSHTAISSPCTTFLQPRPPKPYNFQPIFYTYNSIFSASANMPFTSSLTTYSL